MNETLLFITIILLSMLVVLQMSLVVLTTLWMMKQQKTTKMITNETEATTSIDPIYQENLSELERAQREEQKKIEEQKLKEAVEEQMERSRRALDNTFKEIMSGGAK